MFQLSIFHSAKNPLDIFSRSIYNKYRIILERNIAMTVNTENNKLTVSFGGARLIVEPWGESSVRVRMYPEAAEIPECERLSGSSYYSALTEPVSHNCTIRSEEIDTTAPGTRGRNTRSITRPAPISSSPMENSR